MGEEIRNWVLVSEDILDRREFRVKARPCGLKSAGAGRKAVKRKMTSNNG
jgi:hypothetical protein